MKNWIWLMMLVFFSTSCGNSGSKKMSTDLVNNPSSAETSATDSPQIKFEKTEHDFGRIIQGERVTYQFKFTNTGQSDLLISKVSTSCGCTVGKYPKTAIAPGESDYVEAAFDSGGRNGIQNKTITVLTNTQPNITTLRIKAEIVMPENN
ncbi:MAG: hypothetical protein A2W85_15410 [Bacteroidetes bacterium GWF2_41_31]|nr:MAG: hypothetical protein A2W85_15410 [Bacteroidetes bacterium GWF2_41_31]OFZ08276.1 MAG: hypothetical protein A2338_02610 [Bacteroidetes bacterium RIFOXYB12_FULL_41_6]